MRVLHVVTSMNVGGVQTFLMNIYRKIDREKVQFDFVSMNRNDYFEEEINSLGGKVYHIHNHRSVIKHCIELKEIIKKNNYSTVHIHSSNAICSMDSLVASLSRVQKVIVHSHNTAGGSTMLNKALKPLIGITAHNWFACSDEAAEWLFPSKIVRHNMYKVIHNGIDAKAYEFDCGIRKQYRNKFEFENGELVLGTIGRFYDQKNPYGILNIFSEVLKRNPNSKLVWVGDGPMRAEIEAEISKKSLNNSIILTGVRDDVPELLQMMDVFLLPSKYEGLGIVLVEAQAAGLICFCSDTIPDEVVITNNCKKLSINKMEDWVQNILNIDISNRESKLDEIRAKGYDVQNTVKQLMDFYLS